MADVAVVGAGVFGAWTALRLAEDGHRVALIDAFGPASGRASSADHSRVIRAGYGPDAVYSRWATEARRDWEWLESVCEQPLLTNTGALFLGEPGNDYLRTSHDTLTELKLPAEWLEPSDIAERFPVIAIDGLGPALFEPGAGVLRARTAVQSIVAVAATRAGVEYQAGYVLPADEQRTSFLLPLADETVVDADLYVMACGPWLPKVFPAAVGGRIRPTRQEVLYFGVPPGDTNYAPPQLPVWIDFAGGVYGIPDIDAQGFKVGIDRHGPAIDPDTSDRVVSLDVISTTREWLAYRFPGLAAAPLVDSRVCQYENTPTGDFIIDRHPAWPNVWIIGGGSGHGFKHGPAVARYVVNLIADSASPDPRFSLATKTPERHRAVY